MADIGLVLRKQQSKMGEALSKKSHFTQLECEHLLTLYRKLSEGVEVDRLDRSRFREFLHNAFDMTDDILLDRIFKYFDEDNDGVISREEFTLGLSVFLKGKLLLLNSAISKVLNLDTYIYVGKCASIFKEIMKNIRNIALISMISMGMELFPVKKC